MEQKAKRKTKFALLLVTEKEDGTIRQHTIGSALVEFAAAILFLLAVAVICKFVYDSITIKDARKEIVSQIVTINNLTDENEALSVENSTLFFHLRRFLLSRRYIFFPPALAWKCFRD